MCGKSFIWKNTAQTSNFMLGDTEHDSSSINSTSEFYFGHAGAKIASIRQVCFEYLIFRQCPNHN